MSTTKKQKILLDGGMGQELIRRGITAKNSLWATNGLLNAPDVVQQIHADYIVAGADVITTNNYASVYDRLKQEGLQDQFDSINRHAGKLAAEARERVVKTLRKDVLVAGCLPPLKGSYRPDLVLPLDELVEQYTQLASALDPNVDLFLCETMSTGEEARGAATAAKTFGKPVWVAWTLDDNASGHLRSGETVTQAYAEIEDLNVQAVLFNCCMPESITVALKELPESFEGLTGGYANGFHAMPKDWKYESGDSLPGARRDLSPEDYAAHATCWLESGASVIGGCCEVGPEHILRLRTLLDS